MCIRDRSQIDRVMAELVPRVIRLIDVAAAADINLTIDAEESDRLGLSLAVFEVLADHVGATAPQWSGFGPAIPVPYTNLTLPPSDLV